MAKSFLVPIQMNQLEILQPVMHNNGTDPSGVEGQIYANTASNVLKYHNGSGWETLMTRETDLPVSLSDLDSYSDGGVIIGGATDWTVLAAGPQGYVLTMGTDRPEWSSPGAPSAHDLLGTSHNNTVSKSAPARGDIIRGNSSTNWEALVLGSANEILSSDGSDLIYQSRADLNLAYHNGSPTTNGIPQWSATEGLLTNGLGLVTTVGNPGSDTNLVTEQGIREALAGAAVSALEDVGDVDAYSSISSGELLQWDGDSWVHQTISEIGIAEYSGTPTDEYIPKFTGTRGQIENGYTVVTTVGDPGTDTALVTEQGIREAIAAAISSEMSFQGGYNASTNTPDLDSSPSGVQKGDMYYVTAAGDFFTHAVQIGDVLIANVDDADAEAEWTIVSRDWNETFLELTDSPSAYTSSANYFVRVNSTPDALEFVDAGSINLGDFNNNLASLTQGSNGGIAAMSYNGDAAETIEIDLNNLSTVTTLQGADLFAIYDNSLSGTRNISYTNVLSQIQSDFDGDGYTKKVAVDCNASTSTVVNHQLGTRDVTVHVYRDSGDYDQVECDIEHTDTNNVTVRFATAPSAGEYRIVVTG